MAETSMPPKLVRLAEEEVVGMMVDEALDRDQVSTWDAWRDNPGFGGGATKDGRVVLSEPVEALFHAALERAARRLETSTDPDDENDLLLIKGYLGS